VTLVDAGLIPARPARVEVETTTASVLSYWRDYFTPDGAAVRPNHSTGWIAARLHALLEERGPVTYVDYADRPQGLDADVFAGHFWAFAPTVRENSFGRSVAVYVLSDPVRARELLMERAAAHGVPFPDWDLPPPDFDHEATMELADAVLLVGNRTTLATFDGRWHHKIRLVNYAADQTVWRHASPVERRNEVVYAATHCGLRKGFLDVIDTWKGIPRSASTLHVVGRLEEPYAGRLWAARADSVEVHGWIPSHTEAYTDLLRSCRYAYIPTWVEGQMGTVLEAIAAGCVPITTRASGVDDHVLEHCVVIDPGCPEQHRMAITEVLGWSDERFVEQQRALQECMARHHTWQGFDDRVREVLWG
jgi:glycosyltransferase involved in cell wall biosynthesis